MKTRLYRWTALACLALLPLAACGGGDGDGNGGGNDNAGDYAGTFGSADYSGSIDITVAAAAGAPGNDPSGPSLSAAVTVTATLHITGGGTVNLTGNLNGVALTLAATGWSFNGTLSNGVLTGTFTDPNGNTGTFNAAISTAGANVRVFCGTYSGVDDTPAPESGVFNLVYRANGKGSVVVVNDGDGAVGVLGVRTAGGAIQVYDLQNTSFNVVDDGVITGTKIDGSYQTPTSSGTFHGGTDECQ